MAIEWDGSLEIPFVSNYLTSCPWSQLEELHVYFENSEYSSYLDESAIQHLSRLPRLRDLSLRHLEGVPPPNTQTRVGALSTEQLQPPRFTSLKNLDMGTLHASDIVSFLEYLPIRSPLEALRVEALSDTETMDDDIRGVINLVHERCNPSTLHIFTLQVNEYGAEEDEVLDLDEDGGLNIEPLLKFPKLTSLELSINGRFRLGPEVVERMPTAWPEITVLSFNSTFATTQIPLINHSDLLTLVRGLRHLSFLRIRFDATRITGSELAIGAPLPLQYLYVEDSPISSPSRTVSFLKSNFALRAPPVFRRSKTWKTPLCRTRWEIVWQSGSPWG